MDAIEEARKAAREVLDVGVPDSVADQIVDAFLKKLGESHAIVPRESLKEFLDKAEWLIGAAEVDYNHSAEHHERTRRERALHYERTRRERALHSELYAALAASAIKPETK